MSTSFEEMLNAKPTLEDFQHWTQQIGRAQQLLMEFALSPQGQDVGRTMVQQMMDPGAWGRLFTQPLAAATIPTPQMPTPQFGADWMTSATSFWQDNLNIWQKMMSGEALTAMTATAAASDKDRRFKAAEWHDHPLFAFIRQSYAVIAEHLLQTPDSLEGVDEKTRAQIRFATANIVDALSPSNFALTNPQVLKRTLETRGENLVKGLEHMLKDLSKGL
jgi:polyhydroxyalkanoate synthase